jgi:peptidyl-prolyl cis-trans isomerase C
VRERIAPISHLPGEGNKSDEAKIVTIFGETLNLNMSKKHFFYIILLSFFVFLNWGCGGGERTKRPKDALACVEGECLTERDVEYQIPDAYRATVTPEERKEYVRRWITNEIFYQEAKKEKVDQDKKVQSLVAQAIKEIVVKEFIEGKLYPTIMVTDEEALSYYQQNRDKFVWEDDVLRISHIVTRKLASASLADLLLKQGDTFESVALKLSEDEATKKRGGDLGFLRIQDVSPELVEFISGLKPNEISSPIQTSYGFEIIRITGGRPKGSPKEFEWAKSQIITNLTLEKRQKERDRLLKQLLEKARIETFDWASDIKADTTQ